MHEFFMAKVDTGETTIFMRGHGSGPRLLLLHGFPQTRLMWRRVAPVLAASYSVVCVDLRGDGRSGCPASGPDHAAYAKRAMVRDMIAMMESLGFSQFAVCGHDRGGRVAYRLALDHPERVERLAVMDILPIQTAWRHADAKFALGYWPWSLLAQPEPLPERILSLNAETVIDHALSEWGSAGTAFPADVQAADAAALSQPEPAHAVCDRAAATIDREHDRADGESGRRLRCPVLVLGSARGPLDSWYVEAGGPLALWRAWGEEIEGRPLVGGHFFSEDLAGGNGRGARGLFAYRRQAEPAALIGGSTRAWRSQSGNAWRRSSSRSNRP
jgi:haloacetate dehalogenase